MLLPSRPKNLDHKARHAEKTRIVLEWLVTFRITSLDILSARLGHKAPKICSRFFKSLIEKGFLVRVKYPDVDRKNLVILGNAGARFIDGPERPRTKDLTRVERILNRDQLTHDLQVQKVCLLWVNQASEIVDGRQSAIKGIRPDALYFNKSNQKPHAVEYERWKKSDLKFCAMFIRYMELIESKEIVGVRFYFCKDEDMHIYKNAFDKTEWTYGVSSTVETRDGKTIKTTESKKVIIKADDPRRERFSFAVLRIESAPPIVPLDDNLPTKYVPIREYRERLVEQKRQKRERELAAEAEAEALQRKKELKKLVEEARSKLVVRQNKITRDAEYSFSYKLHELKCQDTEGQKKMFYFAKAPAFEAKKDQFIAQEIARLQAEAAPQIAQLQDELAQAESEISGT